MLLRATLLLLILPARVMAQPPLFDTHLHFDASHSAAHEPAKLLGVLARQGVISAVVTASPPEQALTLYRLAPERILPMLGVYRTPAEKQTWWQDSGLPARAESQLARGPWRGLGELHLFAPTRHSPVFLRLVDLATARGLPLLVHSDPAVIDALFAHQPDATVIWAHAGAYPYPDLLADYLARYPRLYVDLSVREERLTQDGVLRDDWAWLLMRYSDRFMIGVDTFDDARWQRYGEVAGAIRAWLAQLPEEVADAIALRNAQRLFSVRPAD